ncbi:hypothetical protein VTJ83DRAFT_1399 [Remersonia thermophila]|uniref:DUF4604 domain-containing protein n=1 Tax=Remersonia thermophila TaxID=72144 RepID=A0ABR4DP27_9PEZI
MSNKLNAKNLQYNRSLPPFLARLRGEADDETRDGPDPILAARRRPVKPRSASEEAEDAPVVVDERGNVVEAGGVSVAKDGTVTVHEGKEAEGNTPSNNNNNNNNKEEEEEDGAGARAGAGSGAPAEKLASVGGPRKKRKIARIVGAGEPDDEDDGGSGSRRKTDRHAAKDEDGDGRDRATGKPSSAESRDAAKGADGPAAKDKPKKKAKKIKLSFGDDDG